MYQIQRDQYEPVNFFAGDFPVVPTVGEVKAGAKINKYAPLILTDDGITEATADGLDSLVGIAADEPTDGGVVYYQTGEYFADALHLPSGVTVDALTPAFRKLGIFLK